MVFDERDRLSDRAGDAAAAVGERAGRFLNSERHAMGQRARRVAEAMRETGDHIRDDRTVAGFASGAAESIERAAEYLEHADLGALVRDAERFARRRPELFIGGAIVAGLLIGRFLRSERPDRRIRRSRAEVDYGT